MPSLISIIMRLLGRKEGLTEVHPLYASESEILAEMETSCEIVVNRILADLDGANVDFAQDRDKRFILRVGGVLSAKVFLNFSSRSAEISGVFIEGAFRGQGRCRAFTRALYTALNEIHFLKIELRAVEEGRVVWAALGFHPTHSSWKQHKSTIARAINAVRGETGGDLVDLAHEALDVNGPVAFPVIANLRNPGEGHLSPASFPVVILTSIPDWYGEFEIGNALDEGYLLG